jgi:hypothetical protein
MKKQQSTGRLLFLCLLVITAMSCAFLTPMQAQPGTATPVGAGGISAGAGADGGAGSGGAGSGGASQPGGDANNPQPAITPDTGASGPYLVKQTESLGHESIAGQVCRVEQPFSVTATSPRVTFIFSFAPDTGSRGRVTYAYSIPSAGESHDASGTYSISAAGADGTLTLSMAGSDHVVFKGFDGNIPVNYKFDLVPSANTTCQP